MYTFIKTRRVWVWLVFMVILEVSGLWYLKVLPYSRIEVVNTNRVEDLYWNPRQSPDGRYFSPGGITHYLVNPEYHSLQRYREVVPPELRVQGPVKMDDVVRLRQWARAQFRYEISLANYAMFDYEKTIALLKPNGGGGICDAFVTFFVGAALSAGIPARIVHLLSTDGRDYRGHYVTEAWVDEFQKWVVVDVLYNAQYYVGGRPASVMEVRRAYLRPEEKGRPRVIRNGSVTLPHNPRGLESHFNNISVIPRTDFGEYGLPFFGRKFFSSLLGKKLYFIHWVGENGRPLGETERTLRAATLVFMPVIIVAVAGVALFRRKRRFHGKQVLQIE